MDTYLKRYVWIVYLSLISVVAYPASQLTGYLLIAKGEALMKQQITEMQSQATTMKKRPRTERSRRTRWSEQISSRNLFNANPPSAEEASAAKEAEEADKKPTGQLPLAHEECQDSKIKATVTMTMIAEPVEASYAMIKIDSKDRIFNVGDTIEDGEVVSIQWSGDKRRVVVARDGDFECLVLGKKGPKKGRYTPPKRKAPAKKGGSKFQDGIKEVSPGRFEVDRAMLDEQLADLDNLVRQARVIPHYKRGKPAGFKVVGIRSSSIFRHLGLKTGDVLKSVGGEELTSINKALALFEKLKTSDNLSLDFERRGKPVNHEYSIK